MLKNSKSLELFCQMTFATVSIQVVEIGVYIQKAEQDARLI